ncbi:EamA family transporter [Dyadobacter psychrophilus]|uniref:Transporter family protein n=1 Tax=Dyadobacter psychrophilus TaxID=651661 RepID=A0A1T5HG50_9BACT|nr:EamA family transporter [Dyadobacter psychrophilus]SKC19658.1 transporter family protein [Dyadobacter psychrophilus]
MEKWVSYAVISMLFAGLTSVIAKFGLKNVSGDTGLAVRTIVVFILIWANALFFQDVRQFRNLDKSAVLFLAVSGITTSLSWIFYYRAIKVGPVSQVALIDKGSIVIALLLSVWILKEPLSIKTVAGAILIVAGLLVIAWK